jgi:hypothetical protein
MSPTRTLLAGFAVAVAGGPLAAETSPEQCRIWTCTDAALTATASLEPGALPTSVQVGERLVPVSDAATIAPSPDGELRACLGYDPFGDVEVMCLFVP